MIISDTPLDELLKNFLQKKISFELDKKVFKTGKVILYSQKYFYITFVLATDKKKQEKIDIPVPFNFEVHQEDNLIYFDYRVSTLAQNNKELIELMQGVVSIKNKFLNKILTINLINE
jgi:hypothetical protein